MQWVRGVFWSPDFYAQRLGTGRELGFGVLAVVTLLTTLILGLYAIPTIRALRAETDAFVERLPSVHLENGKATALTPTLPYVMEQGPESPMRIIFDTRRTSPGLEELKSLTGARRLLLFVAQDAVTSYDADKSELRSYSFDKFGKTPITTTPQMLHDGVGTAFLFGGAFLFLFLWLFKWVGALLMAACVALVGGLRKPHLPVGTVYVDRLRLASYALVPVLLAQALLAGQARLEIVLLLAIAHYFFVLSLAERRLSVDAGVL